MPEDKTPRGDMPGKEHMYDKYGVLLKVGDNLAVTDFAIYRVVSVDEKKTMVRMIDSTLLPDENLYTAWPFKVVREEVK